MSPKQGAKLFIALSAPVAIIVIAMAFFPHVAAAQEPDPPQYTQCEVVTDTIINLGSYLGYTGSHAPDNPDYATGQPDGLEAEFFDYTDIYHTCVYYSLPGTITGTITMDTQYTRGNIYRESLWSYPTPGELPTGINGEPSGLPGWSLVNEWIYDGGSTGLQWGTVALCAYNGNVLYTLGSNLVDSAVITVTGEICYPQQTLYTCPTVEDHHFTGAITDTWLLSAGASITDTTLTLPPGESASQELSLSPSTGYNAVISVTSVVTPASLDVYLAGLQNIVLTGTGLYTVSFNTTTAASQTYQLINHPASTGDIDIDYTCIYPATITDTAIVCLAPTNGDFDTADSWDWHYNARWNESGLNAYLPYNDTVSDTGKSLVVSSGTYSLPTLITDTWLILAFDSMALGQSGVVATRVGENWQEFDVNSSLYRFEADIGSQAGLTLTTVSFANAGAPEGEFAAVDDLTVDNVCIYVSDTPPNIPTPLNPWLSPFDFGFNFTCNDVPALLAGYGIDVYTPATVYQSGVVTWTEELWVPWLAGAVWNNAGAPVSCFLVEFMRLTAGIAEQFINTYTNVINWNYETLVAGVPWLQEGLLSVGETGHWDNWFSNALRGVFYFGGLNTIVSINWTRSGFIETQNTMSNNTLDVGAETGRVISQIVDLLLGMWNASVIPWMNFTSAASNTASVDERTGESLLDLFGWITGAITGLLNLIWSVLSWLAGLFTMASDVPVEVYHSVRDSVSSEAYVIDVMCTDYNFWCYFWAGVQIVNQTTSQTIAYPVIITGLIIVTLIVVVRNIFAMFSVEIG